MVRRWVGGNVLMASSTETIYNDHAPIFDAIAAGDRARAEQAMANHMAGAISRLPADFFDTPPAEAN
jgi:DNA-binding GntR family transcriptional regulator